jgi:hypothetical protein
MNKLFLTFILSIFVYAASAQGINFQGVARSANGTIIASANISLRLSIISKNVDATPEFIETKTVVTNAQGIFSIVVGDATNAVVTGNFKNIAWKDGIKFLKVEMDQIVINKDIIGLFKFGSYLSHYSELQRYQTSTESSSNKAWGYDFYTNAFNEFDKDTIMRVRPIRSF